ncbi:uncharacterized protein LAESUDRAFT_61526 [Laetiporus sulphureus 93-53]|uniref:RING-type E3 ubiquitin transferase n=1 Tax=Laetiporus sulphureus 93-53 TaxID=1314785 RepID=A0A165F3Q8_9APHY|nr:uncharacterized protein LAESUDRAFT_61526 [Laetiporus sulphureus 93-53]KZT08319.1 hypothetical protein LAESUDRAFT_61526 [Laetiporus sulphureus 93-53]
MSMMATATPDSDEHVLRRVQSTGDLPSNPAASRPSRASDGSTRSEGQVSRLLRAMGPDQTLPRLDPTTSPSSTEESESGHTRVQVPASRPPSRPPSVRRPDEDRRPEDRYRSLPDRLMELIGFSGPHAKERRELMSLVWNIYFTIAQFVIIITLLAYSAHTESPTKPGLTEWQACDRPLGVWNAIWLIRVALGCTLSVWSWRKEQAARLLQAQRERDEDREMSSSHARPAAAAALRPNTSNGNSPATFDPDPPANFRRTLLYSRLTLLATFFSLAWFLTAHILEYTSIDTCRYSSPHLWWLTFGILCILYVMIMEIFLLGLLVFVFGPVIYLLWSILLLCLGRHPLQSSQQVDKLPKSAVEQIPLVLYIPPPPEDQSSDDGPSKPTPITPSKHSYPPKPANAFTRPKRRFTFMRKRKGKGKGGVTGGSLDEKGGGSTGEHASAGTDSEKQAWEDKWEPGDYPFVRLEGNRAVCAICLMDFEEPRRIDEGEERNVAEAVAVAVPAPRSAAVSESDILAEGAIPGGFLGGDAWQEVQVERVSQEERDHLKLDDAGEGPQPLRLLGCGHVFHQTCVDPWLTDVSGRCPICQRPVEIPKDAGKKKNRARRT